MAETRMDAMISRLTTQMSPPAHGPQRSKTAQAVKARPAVEAGSAEAVTAKIFARRAFQADGADQTRPASRSDEPRGGNLDILA